ncbi:MAG: nuclear transport factor 2 family protein, partial [Pseudomonadota bacterium]|nr:nuclear transport factor 2 family protein [Pseudomonadota bacterium]
MNSLEQLVLTYFRGVDEQDPDLIFETLAPDCVFSVETHGVEMHGHKEIQGMFDRLWSHHAAVRHDRFHFVDAGNGADIAVRFRVT